MFACLINETCFIIFRVRVMHYFLLYIRSFHFENKIKFIYKLVHRYSTYNLIDNEIKLRVSGSQKLGIYCELV